MWVLSDFMHWESTFVHRHVGFKLFYAQGAQLLCTGMWVLRGFGSLLSGRGACFVHRHVGFKRFCVEETQLLCTGMWVLSDFMRWESLLVRSMWF